MKELKDIKVYIIENRVDTYEELEKVFNDFPTIQIVNDDIVFFYKDHKDEIDCIVSPGNAFGYMTGGFDGALSEILGWEFQYKVMEYIGMHYYGEQGVGTSFIMDTDNKGLKFIHTTTMRKPSKIKDEMIVYYCMRSALMCAMENDINCIVIPVFGGSCGGVNPKIASKRMKDAYMQLLKASTRWDEIVMKIGKNK